MILGLVNDRWPFGIKVSLRVGIFSSQMSGFAQVLIQVSSRSCISLTFRLILLVSSRSFFKQLYFRHFLRSIPLHSVTLFLALVFVQIFVWMMFLILFHQIINRGFFIALFILWQIRMRFHICLFTIQIKSSYSLKRFVSTNELLKTSLRDWRVVLFCFLIVRIFDLSSVAGFEGWPWVSLVNLGKRSYLGLIPLILSVPFNWLFNVFSVIELSLFHRTFILTFKIIK